MNGRTHAKRLAVLAIAALGIVLVINGASEARGAGGHGGGGGFHSGGAVAHQGFVGHHGFDGHHFDGRFHGRFGFGAVPIVPFSGYYAPAYPDLAPVYWYYCPSYGAYYPGVTSCPEPWVPVPGS